MVWQGNDRVWFGHDHARNGNDPESGGFSRVLKTPGHFDWGRGPISDYACLRVRDCLPLRVTTGNGLGSDHGFELPGGTASNAIVYLARGEVALSVSMTMISTLLAVFLTPALVFSCGSLCSSRSLSLLKSVLWIVLCPLAVGVVWNRSFPRSAKVVSSFSPFFPSCLSY